MEKSLIPAFAILGVLCLVVAIDELLEQKPHVLGEEWDFTRSFIK